MNRLSFRPRPLDIHKKIPIVKSIKEFEDDDAPAAVSTHTSHARRVVAEVKNEVRRKCSKKVTSEIPIPQFVVVDTYERDYLCTFRQPSSYVRGRGVGAELGEFVEYDLDDEDEDWLQDFNNERKTLSPEKFESLLFKLEVLDHRARERAGMMSLTLGSPVPVLLQLDTAVAALQSQALRYTVFQSVYKYWKKKREKWQKPILRQLQPSPSVNDTNPYNVFRPREKAHRRHTRRMQRRENNVSYFEKLCQVRHNLEQAKTVLKSLIKREEKKCEVVETDVSLQQIQIRHKLIEDAPSHSCKLGSIGDEHVDYLDDGKTGCPCSGVQNLLTTGSELMKMPTAPKHELKWQWLQMMNPHEPLLLFTKPLDRERLAAAGLMLPSDPCVKTCSVTLPYRFRGRMGRGGRIIFDRWKNPQHVTD